jgi:predicted peroxiredoxin
MGKAIMWICFSSMAESPGPTKTAISATATATGDCPGDYLPDLVKNEVQTGICTPCAKNRNIDEASFHSNMQLDGGPHLIDMAAEAKVFNF